MNTIRLALDWTPNANHIGFLVAVEKGYYTQADVDVELITPAADNYETTPAKKVELGLADLALCPLESVISYRTKAKPFYLKAIAALFTEDLSAIVTLNPQVKSPKDLDGKSYASYQAKYEDKIVMSMIKNDGGKGDLDIHYPEKLGIWNTLTTGKYEATWIFQNWEGVEAKQKGIALTEFKLKDYGIPYSYSPVIVAAESAIENNGVALQNFLNATRKGFAYAKSNNKQAADLLKTKVSISDYSIDFVESIRVTANCYADNYAWGTMDYESVQLFLNWLKEQEIEPKEFSARDLVTNELLPN